MQSLYKRITDNTFFRNAFKVFSGNILSQSASFLFLPVFSRIYSPEDYGLWGIFAFLGGFISVFASFRYELAIMIPSSLRMARIIFYVASSFAFIVCTIMFVSSFFLAGFLSDWLNTNYKIVFYLVPLHALITAMNNILVQWLSRIQKFSQLSRARMIQAFSNIGVSFVAGYLFKWHEGGLIAGLMISVLVTNAYLSHIAGLPIIFPRLLRAELYKKIVNRYRNFLYYSTPLGILNYYTNNILVTVIQINFGAYMMGLFSNANRLVQTPFSMISSAVSMVFYPHFSRSDRKLRDVLVVFTSLFFVFSLILLPMVFWGEEIIGFYLGAQWIESALYIRLLFAYFVVSYSVSCISPMFAFIQKEGVVLIWQIALLIISVILLTLLRHDFKLSILAYSLLSAFAYIVLLLIGVILLKYKVN